MAAATGLTVIKRFTYRGVAEDYSNTYWFTGSVPSDAAAWRALFNAVANQEKTLFPSTVTIVGGYGYADDTGHKSGDTGTVSPAVWSVDLTVSPETPVAGTYVISGYQAMPGDDAVWIRWKTSRLNSKGKAIYLRKYYHPAITSTGGSTDNVATAQITALNAVGAKLQDGTFLDARTVTAPGHTDTILSHGASAYVTTRSLKRRGKRPGS